MEQLNPGQVKKYLKQLKQRQDQYLYYLGQLAYKAGEQEKLDDPEMLEAYRTLKEIQGQIVPWESSLEQLKAAREAAKQPRCPYCGSPVIKGAVFCPSCGQSVAAAPAAAVSPVATTASVAAQPAPPAAGRACPGCGAPLDEDAAFCGNCGARVAVEPAQPVASPPQPVPHAAPATPPPATAETAPAGGRTEPEAGVAEKAPEPVEETAGEAAACPGCGTTIGDPAVRFCPECGTKVRE